MSSPGTSDPPERDGSRSNGVSSPTRTGISRGSMTGRPVGETRGRKGRSFVLTLSRVTCPGSLTEYGEPPLRPVPGSTPDHVRPPPLCVVVEDP